VAAQALGVRTRLPHPALAALIVTFLLLALLGVVTAHSRGTPLKMSLLELRPLLSLLLVFPLVAGARRMRDLTAAVRVVLIASAITSLVILGEYVVGHTGTVNSAEGAKRVHGALFVYPAVLALWAGAMAALSRAWRVRLVCGAAVALGLGGLFFTFQRGAWVGVAAGAVTLLVLLPSPARRRAALAGPLIVVAAVGVVFVANAFSSDGSGNIVRAGAARAASIASFDEDASAQHRLNEWRRAGEEVREKPLRGIGLGSTITFYSPLYNPETFKMGGLVTAFYIHSSYIWLALKLGLVAALVFLGLIGFAAVLGFRALRAANDDTTKVLLVGALTSLVAVAVISLAGPHLTGDNSTPFLAGLLALLNVLSLGAGDEVGGSRNASHPAV
jgi:O-antigen ligase